MIEKPVIAGTRITVESILDRIGAGETVETIVTEHPRLTREAAAGSCPLRGEGIAGQRGVSTRRE